jgi:hypothetical protein
MNKIISNKANFQKSQMFITLVSTGSYNEKTKLDTWSKQTQTKPIHGCLKNVCFAVYFVLKLRKCLLALKKERFSVCVPGGFRLYSAGRWPGPLRKICGEWSLRPARSIWESDLQKKSVRFSDLSGCENFSSTLLSKSWSFLWSRLILHRRWVKSRCLAKML